MVTKPADQASGYTLDLIYSSQFELSQSPLRMRWAAICHGAPARSLAESFSYCDLGCGDGSSLNVLAACYPEASFIGVDINPDHLKIARHFAARAGLRNVTYLQASFDELSALDFAEFDYIALFGIYTWLNASLRQSVHDFVADKLKPGGLFAIHYSSLPGSARGDMIANYLKLLCASHAGDSTQRLIAGMRDLRRLSQHIRLFERDSEAATWLENVGRLPANLLAHDLLNRETRSFYFEEVHGSMAALGLRYVGSSQLFNNYPELQMSKPAFEAYSGLAGGADTVFGQSLRDLMLDAGLRIDLYWKQESRAVESDSSLASADDLFLQRAGTVGELEARQEITEKFAADLTSNLHTAVLEVCSSDALRVPEVLGHSELREFDSVSVATAVQQLIATEFLSLLVAPTAGIEYDSNRRYRLTSQLNRAILSDQLTSTARVFVASTILGGPLELPEGIRIRLQAFLGGSLDRAWAVLHERSLKAGVVNRVAPLERFQERVIASLPAFIANDLPHLLELGILEEDS